MPELHKVHLSVKQPKIADTFRDRVRIPALHRGAISEGSVCKLSVNDKFLLVEVRGIRLTKSTPDPGEVIQMDEITRAKLGVQLDLSYGFSLQDVGLLGDFRWAWYAADPAPRIAARLGIIGIALGAVALLISLWPR